VTEYNPSSVGYKDRHHCNRRTFHPTFHLEHYRGLFGIPLWNLLKVLAVPLTIGGAVPLFNWLQKRRELERENQSAQDVALQAYLGAMSELIIDHQLRTSQWDEGIQAAARQLGEHASTEDVRTVAWARTSTVLPLLDGERKGRVIQFLYESDLITKDNRVVSLQRCDLKKASLSWTLAICEQKG
jgi:hypothetical protein